jgi:hypothetical protein
MEAFLIDPFNKTVTRCVYNGTNDHIYELIGCDLFDIARIGDDGDGIFVDDEGLGKEGQKFFSCQEYPYPLAGKGLVLGCDMEGNSVTPKITLDELRATISWVEPLSVDGDVIWIDSDERNKRRVEQIVAALLEGRNHV